MTEGEQFKTTLGNAVSVSGGLAKENVINRLLSHEQNLGETENMVENSVVFAVTEEEENFLENYGQKLAEKRSWAEKANPAETVPSKENQFQMLESMVGTLRNEIAHAVEEDIELEQIAAAVEDSELARKADMEMHQLKDLRNRIEAIIDKEKNAKEFLEKIEILEDKIGGLHNINQALETRIAIVEILHENSERRREDKTIRVGVPPWEQERFETDHVNIELHEDSEASQYLEACNAIIDAADSKKSFGGDTSVNVEVKTGEIPYARKVRNTPSDRRTDLRLMEGQKTREVEVWQNAAFTMDPESTDGDFSSDQRFIVMDERLLDYSKPATIATMLHELMHAYLEHTGDYTHFEIHENCLQVLVSTIRAMEDKGRTNFSSEISLQDLRDSYLYGMASSTMFPDK